MSNLDTRLWGTWEFLSTLCAIAADCKYHPSSLPVTCFCWGSHQPPQDAPVSLLAVDIFSNLNSKLSIFAFQDSRYTECKILEPPPPFLPNEIKLPFCDSIQQRLALSIHMRNFLRYSVIYLFVILQWKWNARKWGNKGSAFQPLQHHGLFGVNILSSSLMY